MTNTQNHISIKVLTSFGSKKQSIGTSNEPTIFAIWVNIPAKAKLSLQNKRSKSNEKQSNRV